MIRRQLILSMDIILNAKPQSVAAIDAYVCISLNLATDDDTKVMETAMDSFKRNVFDNIQPYEKTSSEKHLFPWRLLQSMLNGTETPDLRQCINHWVSKKLLT